MQERDNAERGGRDDPPPLAPATREQMKTESPDGALTSQEATDAATEKAGGDGEGRLGQAEAKVGEVLGQARDAATNLAESGRTGAADALEGAAGRLEGAASGEGSTSQVADRTAEGMHAAAGYLQDHDTSEVLNDVEQFVKTHPMQSVLVAVAAGLVIGRALR